MRSSSTTKKTLFFVAIIICLILINSLGRSLYDLWHKQDLVVKTQNDLSREKKENQRLKEQLSYVSTNDFIESEARNKLFMVKPGESGVIVPPGLGISKNSKKEPELSNWQKWIELFK